MLYDNLGQQLQFAVNSLIISVPFHISMLVTRINNKYASQANNTLLKSKENFIKTKQKRQTMDNHKKSYIVNDQTHLKTSANSQFKKEGGLYSRLVPDENNSDLANQNLLYGSQNNKCNSIIGKVNQERILQLINAYPVQANSYPVQVQRKQNVHRKYQESHSEQNSDSKVFTHKKIKTIKKQFQVKRQRETIRLKTNKINFLANVENKDKINCNMQQFGQQMSDEGFQIYNVYRDQQIFPQHKQYTQMTIAHRLDNDIDSDDEQIEKVVKKMTNFLVDTIRTFKFVEMMKRQHQALMNQEESQ